MSGSIKKQSDPVISASQTADHGSSATIPCGSDQGTSIELVRDGDVIREILVYCSCGENTRVICSYE